MSSPSSTFWNTVMDSAENIPYGKRLIPVIIDEIARDDPERICFSYPRSSNLADGFQDLDFRTFANAIDKTAYFIQREIGRSSMFETVLFMGHPDVRYFILFVALMKTGHKLLLSSHRNSVAEHANLIKRTDCTILFHTAGFPVSGILEKCRLETICIPNLDDLLDDTTCDPYPYTFTFDEAKKHPCLVLHTSGATGLPKPVVWTQEAVCLSDAHHLIAPLDGRRSIWGAVFDESQRKFCALPIFHGAGVISSLSDALFNKTTTVLGPPGLATAETLSDILDYANIDSASCFPVTLEEVATRPDVASKLSRLKFIHYTGGTLSQDTGNALSQHVRLLSIMASTEIGALVQHETDQEDWKYICLNPKFNGVEMLPRGNLYEMIFTRQPDAASFQGIFKNYPNLKEYSMPDVYSKHPTKPHHWKHEARVDDIIVFKSGWNFNPIVHEQSIMSHPAVLNCMLVGNGRDKPAAIIELRADAYTEDEGEKRELLDMIWPKIQEANNYADTTGQLAKTHIIFGKKEKLFSTAGKGTVQRKALVTMYELEIDELYNRVSGEGLTI